MTLFDDAVDIVFSQEGGESNDADDPGGHTNLGITEQTFNEAKQAGVIPHSEDLSKLTRDKAKTIYREMYWNTVKGDDLPRSLAIATFDAAVNMGPAKAISMLQQAVGVRIDGVVGRDTIAAAIKTPSEALDRMLAARVVYYGDIVNSKPVMQKYRWGWIRRCFTIARLASKE